MNDKELQRDHVQNHVTFLKVWDFFLSLKRVKLGTINLVYTVGLHVIHGHA